MQFGRMMTTLIRSQSSDDKNNNTNVPLEHATSDNPLCTSSGGSVSYVTVTSANLEKITEGY